MRISDWSSDVCSSDLCEPRLGRAPANGTAPPRCLPPCHRRRERHGKCCSACPTPSAPARRSARLPPRPRPSLATSSFFPPSVFSADGTAAGAFRSEEHTSELQSLMRISYAVFCLKKKNEQETTRQ